MEGNKLDLFNLGHLDFIKPDTEVFVGLDLAFKAGRKAGNLPTVFNAANEMAVALFLDKKIGFTDIYRIIRTCMDRHSLIADPTVEEILETEKEVYRWIDEMQH